MTLERGTRLGPYQIESPIGAGGMGEVYKATDTRLERTVAIKVLPAHVASNPDRKARFEREAKTVAALSHTHICPVFDVGFEVPSLPDRHRRGGQAVPSPSEGSREGQAQFEVPSPSEGSREGQAQFEVPSPSEGSREGQGEFEVPSPLRGEGQGEGDSSPIDFLVMKYLAFCDDTFADLTDDNAMEYVEYGQVEVARGALLAYLLVHSSEMYGIGTVYLRAKDLVPPSTEREMRHRDAQSVIANLGLTHRCLANVPRSSARKGRGSTWAV